jgi:hypothetical protein
MHRWAQQTQQQRDTIIAITDTHAEPYLGQKSLASEASQRVLESTIVQARLSILRLNIVAKVSPPTRSTAVAHLKPDLLVLW